MLLVAQAAVAGLVAMRLAWPGLRPRGANFADLLPLAACIAVAILSIASFMLGQRRSRTLKSAIARNETLQVEVDTDPLTGLGSRRSFDQAVEQAFGRARREARGVSLLVIDIDHFKAFNDSYGHVEGDRVLRATAQAIQEVLAGDRAYRIGGEELAVVLFATPLAVAAQHARLILAALDAMRQPHRHGVGGIVTVSIGVAEGFPAATPLVPETLIAATDRALYEAKAAGRACVRLATIAPRSPSAQAQAPDHDGECVEGLDILLPNGSRLAINSRLRLSTVRTILSMVSLHPAD